MAMIATSSSLALLPPPSPTRGSSAVVASSPFSGNIDLVHQWDEDTVGEWLKSVNCGKYRSVFVSNNINGDALLDCDQNILKEVGVNKVGDRIRIMVAVKALRAHAASLSKAARMEVASSSPLNGSYSPTAIFSHYYARSGNNSANSSPSLVTRSTMDTTPHSPIVTERPAHLRHHKSSPSIDGGGIMSIDHVRQNCAKFIGEEGQTRIVNISDCSSARAILTKVLKKFNVQDDSSNWCIYTIKDRSNAARLTDAELLQYCHDPAFPERERLILCKRNRTPGAAEIHRAQEIAKEQRAAAQEKIIAERKEGGAALLGRTKTNKLEGFFGERPTSFGRPDSFHRSSSGNSPPSHTSSPREQARPNTKRLRNFFGQRPPSELISSNLAEYFPDHEKNVLEETVRNSIRRSTRMSHAARRLSTATTASSFSTPDKDIPPLPPLVDAWKDSASVSSGSATPPLSGPRRRPVLMRRAVPSASYVNSIVESLVEDDESSDVGNMTEVEQTVATDTLRKDSSEEDKGIDTLQLSDSGTDTSRGFSDLGTDTIRQSSDVNTMIDLSGSDKADEDGKSDTKSEDDDSEDDYEEGEFDAVGGGPTRWIRGALIGMGSFGSVYLGMNRTSGELMAVKQVELPSHDVQGEQRKQSMLIALQREIALLRDLTHENIVHYIGSSTDDKFLNIFLEYVPGGSVVQLLTQYGPFEEPLVRNFVRQILCGLNYLHERDIIHRDIKGANVLVDNKGVIKISDFGISKKVEANLLSTAAVHHPHRPSLQGSVYWMAPEVVRQTSYTRKADIWSLGCLIVEMFTGSHPFPDFSQMQAIFKIGTSCTPDIPEHASDDAKDFLTKTFELDHHNRPSASELMDHPFLSNAIDDKSKADPSSAPATPTKSTMTTE